MSIDAGFTNDFKNFNTHLDIHNAPHDTPAQVETVWEKQLAEGGMFTKLAEFREAMKKAGYKNAENFWLATKGPPTPDPFKATAQNISTLNALQKGGHSNAEILKEAKLEYPKLLKNVDNVDTMMNTEGFDIDLVHSRLTRGKEDIAAKDKGKNISITFNAQLENIESQVPDLETKGPLEVPRTEVVKILDVARRTGFVTADEKATLHKYALQLSKTLPKDQTWFITSDSGETTKMTSDQIYQRLSKDIDAFIIKESTKTLPGI